MTSMFNLTPIGDAFLPIAEHSATDRATTTVDAHVAAAAAAPHASAPPSRHRSRRERRDDDGAEHRPHSKARADAYAADASDADGRHAQPHCAPAACADGAEATGIAAELRRLQPYMNVVFMILVVGLLYDIRQAAIGAHKRLLAQVGA